tara:strand:- start:186 stop:404 length:219 start_codon:yes stop_codon:yes gene_type:complete
MVETHDDWKQKQKERCHERVTSMSLAKSNEMVDRTLGILRNCAVPKDYFKDVEKMVEHFEFLKNGNTIYREQ